MLPPVGEDIEQHIPYLAGRRELAPMVAIAPYAPPAIEGAIHGLRHADRETLDTTPQARRRVRLDEKVQVVDLYAEMEEAERMPRGGGECRTYGGEEAAVAK